MSDIIASTTSTTAYQVTADTTGALNIKTGSTPTTAVTVTSAGLFQINSGYGSVATAYGCRAWVNFNGTGTVAIRASGNVSSITDNGTGDYTVNFTTAMPDANYSYTCESGNFTDNNGFSSNTTTSCRVRCFSKAATTTLQDSDMVCVSLFR